MSLRCIDMRLDSIDNDAGSRPDLCEGEIAVHLDGN